MTSAYFAQRLLNGKEITAHGLCLEVDWDLPAPRESSKFTCRFDINIPNDKEFQVARRIIGSKGKNMKRIIDVCTKNSEADTVKLRLRGQGSGFKEGPQKKESREPLHLCISSKCMNAYTIAQREAEHLLAGIFSEYSKYCKKKGIIRRSLTV